jgi:hypothetical protein
MATITYHIYSRHDQPIARSTPIEDLETDGEDDVELAWEEAESSLAGARRQAERANAPRFVKAGEAGVGTAILQGRRAGEEAGREVAGWYRKVMRGKLVDEQRAAVVPVLRPTPRPTPNAPRLRPTSKSRRTKSDWFISKALSSSSTPTPPPPPPQTLPDILARDPPPHPTAKEKFKPPVWSVLGPANKGFAMLVRKGWIEGEGLGAGFVGRRIGKEARDHVDYVAPPSRDDLPIDLELPPSQPTDLAPTSAAPDPYAPTALLTPLPTTLKSDRLGIGLKPLLSTVPGAGYKAPRKRVTHGAEALAAHVRAGEAMKRRKVLMGRGGRGFERERRREAEERRGLLAYLNE